jgi:hypothetical protein
LVGSLVFFLVEILYAGKYEGRLLWTLFFFVAGIVLVARVAIQVDRARAAGYGLALALVSWMALLAFIEYPKDSAMSNFAGLINFVLMAVVWWSANKLTWDCTHIDENRRASGKGLLAAAGMEKRPETTGLAREDELQVVEIDRPVSGQRTFFERWARFRERRKKRPHTPGQTIIWFSLAALPIFGLGQSLIPSDEPGRRSFTFWLAAIYVGSAMGLLLTTSFLGLRRYLRQRKLQMPMSMTGIWLGMGALLVVGFLVVGALLPRPYSETPVWALKRIGSGDKKASKNAVLKGDAGKGEGAPGDQTTPGDGKSTAKGGKPGGKGEDGESKQGSGDKKDGDGDGKDGNDKSGDGKQGDDRSKDSRSGSSQRDSEAQKAERGKDGDSSDKSNSRFPDTKLGQMMEKVAGFLKWVVFIVLGVIVLVFLFRGALKYFANFSPWAKNLLAALSAWWSGLFGKREKTAVQAVAEQVKPKPRPFSSYTNPFTVDDASGRSTEELIEYSFTAFEAWAADRNHPRRPDETALEFASRLSNMFPSLEGEPHQLAILVVCLAYANSSLPADARETLERVWDHLTSAMPVPSEAA